MNKALSYFLIISSAHLFSIAFGFGAIQLFTKPLLMISLLFYFVQATKGSIHPTIFYIKAALIASFFGDVFLMFTDAPKNGQLWFLAGLGSFLLAQLTYANSFYRLHLDTLQEKKAAKKTPIKVFLLPGLFFFLMISLIWSGLPNDLTIPVIIYGIAIATMVGTAMNLEQDIAKNSFLLIFSGAVLFMCSDSLIALNKFTDKLSTLWNPSFWIMLTYILGQAGIVIGLTRNFKMK